MNLSGIKQGFGVVTVINAKCVPIARLLSDQDISWKDYCKNKTAQEIANAVETFYEANKESCCYIDSLKIANITMEGPTKTITGGQYASPLIKFGKTATCEMQDALGNPKALELLGGVTVDDSNQMHFTSKFGAPVCIIGDTFVIDKLSGEQVPVREVIYEFIPDSIINLTQDAEGDATVFDLNGSLGATDISDGQKTLFGTFYSIIDPKTTTTEGPAQG